MNFTIDHFRKLFPKANPGVYPHLNIAMARFHIDTPVRAAMFLAQVGHECTGFTVFAENLNYSAAGLAATWKVFRNADGTPTAKALALARKPMEIANYIYAGKNGNGSESSGDGWKYRGRGPIQITGVDNYRDTGRGISADLLTNPEWLERPEFGCPSAAFYWASHKFNDLADAGRFSDIGSLINTGRVGNTPKGAEDRRARWSLAVEVLRG